MASSGNLQNPAQCLVKNSPGKGRGVFAATSIPRHSIVEISPVLLFTKEEYEQHGKYTILDSYTFKWKNGSMALALGLGSLFNHSDSPNVSYTIDACTDSIRYIAARNIEPDEELCIYYGHNLWFDPAGAKAAVPKDELDADGWGGLTNLQPEIPSDDAIVPEEDLPFERFKPPPEEETAESIRTVQAWAVDVPDQRSIGPMLKWLKHSEVDADELGHLKRVRKQGETSTFLLNVSPEAPALPQDIQLSEPFLVKVPSSAALTTTSLAFKNVLWPTTYAPRRKGEADDWSMGKVVQEALRRRQQGELPVAAYVPTPYEASDDSSFMAHDTRQSAAHPLRHAVMNVIRHIADDRARSEDEPQTARNGTNYLLTSRILFTTHEPCIMCSMALLHSRVKEVVYLIPMEKTGGCGGSICLPTLPGVNHRFGICRWKGGTIDEAGLQLGCVNGFIEL
ncbi:cytidine deaminase-like protein [Roridomyces roridus]|uniref:Cytidine deaminase-like protein n=1 Tax=Roridomyces roridus TaxID=1738132 RepID=A0AAD7CAX6_9AGAR|nr:cytidine deaminase-like protein [Roridomyces roridus]